MAVVMRNIYRGQRLPIPGMKLSESEIKREIRQYLRMRGIFAWNQWQGQMSVPGVQDLIGILPGGRILGIEIKVPSWKEPKPGKSQRWDRQKAFIQRINEAGGLALVATSVEDVVRCLGEE